MPNQPPERENQPPEGEDEPPEREDGPSGAPDARRTWTRPAAVAGLVAGIALAAVLVGGAVSGGLAGGPAAVSPTATMPPVAIATTGPSGGPSGPSVSPVVGPSPATPGTPATEAPATPAMASTPTPATPTPSPTATASTPASPAAEPTRVTPALAARLEARLRALLKSSGIPGASAAIVWDDGRRWSGAAGSADLSTATAMTTDTAFAFASVSKTLTAAVVLQLVGEGKLALDHSVAPLLPEFRLDPRITVRMLLDHTSGLPDFFLNPRIDKALRARPDTAWTALRAWSYVPAKHAAPGKSWNYSNTNYMLLGELVEAVTGHPLAVEVRSRLLDPLKLATAWFQVAEKPRTDGAIGYRRVAKAGGGFRYVPVAPRSDIMPFRSVVTAAGGAGSIAATALDAALWMRAFAGGDVLPADMQAAMIGDVAATKALGARIPYGLGIQEVPLDGRRALGHSGRYLGFRNVVRYVPEAGVTIAVLTNQGTYDPAKIATALLRIVAPKPTVAPASPAP